MGGGALVSVTCSTVGERDDLITPFFSQAECTDGRFFAVL